MLKKLIFISFIFFSNTYITLAEKVNPSRIIPVDQEDTIVRYNDWYTLLDWIILFFRNSIFNLLALIAIWVFLYIWARLVVARWNPEELKKTWTSLIYAVIWIVVVTLSWAIVRLVAWLDF